MFRFIKPYRVQAALSSILLVCVVIADLAIPRLTQQVIDQGISAQDLNVIIRTSALMLGASVLSALFSVGNTLLSVRAALSSGADIRSAIVRKVQTWSFGNLDRIQTGKLLVRATSDVNMVQMIILMSLRMLTRAPLWMLGSTLMLIATSTRLALLMLVLLPAVLGMIWFFLIKTHPLFLAVQESLDKLNQTLQENLAGIRVVKAFMRQPFELTRFGQANDDLTASNIKVMQLTAALVPSMLLLVNLSIAGVIWFGGRLVIAGDLTVGEIVASVNYILFSLFPLVMLGGMAGPISAANASAGRIWEVLDSKAEVQHRQDASSPPEIAGRITFENVCFSYNHGHGALVLKNVNLTAKPGQTVAILGATGSGKSSLVNLIPRFYDSEHGRVMIDDVDVRDMPLETLRTQTGIALQETVLFSGTIAENIRFGRPDATREEIVAAAKAAQAHDFITAFPQGYDTMVGQRGVNLSGGQKQRIAIARALLIQPKILILDDSTSAVDVETEAKIEEALEGWMQGRTTLIVAQRLSTVLNADQILVLEGGQIVSRGTHAELIEESSIYQEIIRSQLGDGVTAGD